MVTVAFAFVTATAMFFIFERTRWMGIVGVFVLLCINPVLFGGLLLIIGGVICLVYFRRKIHALFKSATKRH